MGIHEGGSRSGWNLGLTGHLGREDRQGQRGISVRTNDFLEGGRVEGHS